MNIKIKQIYFHCKDWGNLHPYYLTCEEDKEIRAKYGERIEC